MIELFFNDEPIYYTLLACFLKFFLRFFPAILDRMYTEGLIDEALDDGPDGLDEVHLLGFGQVEILDVLEVFLNVQGHGRSRNVLAAARARAAAGLGSVAFGNYRHPGAPSGRHAGGTGTFRPSHQDAVVGILS